MAAGPEGEVAPNSAGTEDRGQKAADIRHPFQVIQAESRAELTSQLTHDRTDSSIKSEAEPVKLYKRESLLVVVVVLWIHSDDVPSRTHFSTVKEPLL